MRRELRLNFAHRDRGRRFDRAAIDAAADRGKHDSANLLLARETQGFALARGEQVGCALVAARPKRGDRVDHLARRQPETRRDARFAGRTAHAATRFGQRATGGEQPGPGGAVDCAVDIAAAEQGSVCGIDDRVEVEGGNVGFQDFN